MKNLIFLTLIFLLKSTISFTQTNNYRGTFNGDPITGTLTFNKDETVTGTISFSSNSARIYKISGTNFVKGEMEITISYQGKRISSGSLSKSLSDTHIIWSGTMINSGRESMFLELKRPR